MMSGGEAALKGAAENAALANNHICALHVHVCKLDES